jgi:hypothetical protein
MAQGAFDWNLIDQVLVGLKLSNLAEEMRKSAAAEEAQIRFDNLRNENSGTVPALLIRMQERLIDHWIAKTYEVYCEVWETQGNVKSAEFVRAVSLNAIPVIIAARTTAIVGKFASENKAMGYATEPHDARMASFKSSMQRLATRWARKLEIEARECEHRDRIASPRPKADEAPSPSEFPVTNPSRTGPSEISHNADRTLGVKPAKRYRSQLKRAILIALMRNPKGSDLEVCRSIDEDGSAEVDGGDRTLESAYKDPQRRSSLEVTISKVRSDLRKIYLP